MPGIPETMPSLLVLVVVVPEGGTLFLASTSCFDEDAIRDFLFNTAAVNEDFFLDDDGEDPMLDFACRKECSPS
jgi:hypothetical protein